MHRVKINFPKNFRRRNEPPTGMGALRKRLGRASRIGAVVLLIASAALAIVSYRFPNVVIEVDSVIAFAAAIVLLFRETTHSVQLRVVDRILESSHELSSNLASLSLEDAKFYYAERGKRVEDVVVVVTEVDPGRKGIANKAALELVPPGRSLSQLFLREMPLETFSFDDLARALPSVVSGGLGLASTATISRINDMVEVKLLRPVLKDACGKGGAIQFSLICVTCSLFAILICHASRRSVVVESCSAEEGEITTIKFRLSAMGQGE